MPLTLYNQYDRRDVHDIFEPLSSFTPQAGTWGLQGIVQIKNNPKDYVFFVTLGTTQGNHAFQEEIFDDGTITWQSQPSNKLNHKYVIDLINHDSNVNTIYLFLRTSKRDLYTYMGPLAYVSHDSTRQCPVYFMWSMLDFDMNRALAALPSLTITSRATGNVVPRAQLTPTAPVVPTGMLTLQATPTSRRSQHRSGVNTAAFSGRNVDFQGEAKKNSATGNAGEDAVVRYEVARLNAAGCPNLAAKVTATRYTIGNTAKYDVLSFETNGTERYIEVKTTTGADSNRIHISEGEVCFSEQHPTQYYLYRVYNFDKNTGTGDFNIKQGPVDRTALMPTNYTF